MPLVDSVNKVQEIFNQIEVHIDTLPDGYDTKIALYKWVSRLATAIAIREMEIADMLIEHEVKIAQITAGKGY